jgi:hypothetical protein
MSSITICLIDLLFLNMKWVFENKLIWCNQGAHWVLKLGVQLLFFLNFVPLHIEIPYNFGGTGPILGVKNPLQRVNGHAGNKCVSKKIELGCEEESDWCSMQNEQYFSFIMARTCYIRWDDNDDRFLKFFIVLAHWNNSP